MACSRGKASPDAVTVKRLFSSSGGFCQKPDCREPLFESAGGKTITIGELAHIFSAIDNGPRTNTELTPAERGHFDNIILLCANCHTKIDKAEEHYNDEVIRKWKENHIETINSAFGVKKYESRRDVWGELNRCFNQNNAIFEAYGPHSESAFNPESPDANIWTRKIQTHILPNNRKIHRLIDENYELLNDHEVKVAEELFIHIDDFEAKHLGITADNGKRFPVNANNLFKDEK